MNHLVKRAHGVFVGRVRDEMELLNGGAEGLDVYVASCRNGTCRMRRRPRFDVLRRQKLGSAST